MRSLLGGLRYATADHVFHGAGINASICKRGVHCHGAQIRWMHARKPTVAAASGGAQSSHNICFRHRTLLEIIMNWLTRW
jgi:hypothetical protein